MAPERLLILRENGAGAGAAAARGAAGDEEAIPFGALRERLRSGALLGSILRYREVVLRTERADVMPRPLLTALLLRALSRGRCRMEDSTGAGVDVTAPALLRLIARAASDGLRAAATLRSVERHLSALEECIPPWRRPMMPRDPGRPPVYLRTDPWYGVRAGGSVAHISGVLNHLGEHGSEPIFITTDPIPTVDDAVRTFVVPAPERYRDFGEMLGIGYSTRFEEAARSFLGPGGGTLPGFLYCRHGVFSYAGVRLAHSFGVPLVLEYNGSEVWISRHWGRPLRFEAIAARIEKLNLRHAHLIVVVSEVLAEELRRRGIEEERILVNPNAVDAERYHPGLDGGPVRRRLGLDAPVVVGFIGTFGPWHGAEVLAEAWARLVDTGQERRPRAQLLLIGDGEGMPAVRRALERRRALGEVIFAGRVDQADAPAYLAACDILASPHVDNPDGTTFFGSPTKLFEYMAMGRAIVASDLAQIGEVLEHRRSAWLVPPGDPAALAEGIGALLEDPGLRRRLGREARELAVERHTWRTHTRRIIERLDGILR